MPLYNTGGSASTATTQITAAAPTGVSATDTATITNALAALGGAGRVLLRAGTYVVTGITLNTGQWLCGQGYEATIIKQAAATSGPLVQSKNFATLTGTDTIGTPYNLGIENLTLDDNKASQSVANNVVSLYAYGYALRNVRIRNGKGWGLWTEWALQSTSPGNDSMESLVSDFKIHDCDGGGLSNQGPHDTQFVNGIVYKNGAGSGSYAISVPADGRANGSQFANVHVWGGTYDYGLYVAGSGISFSDCQVEGGLLAEAWVKTDKNRFDDCKLFAGGVNTSTVKGLVLGTSGTTVNNIRFSGYIENCGGGAVDLTYANSHITIDTHAYWDTAPSATVIGTVPSYSTVRVYAAQNTGANTGSLAHVAGASTLESISAAQVPLTLKGYFGGQSGNLLVAGNTSLDAAGNTLSVPTLTPTIGVTGNSGWMFGGHLNPGVFVETIIPFLCGAGNASLTGGTITFVFFTPDRNTTVSNIITACRGTVSSSSTLSKMGLYSFNGTTATCIARTASDTALWNASGQYFSRAIADDGQGGAIASVALTRGSRYAFALLQVGGTGPQLLALNTQVASLGNIWGASYCTAMTLATQTDLPATAAYSGMAALGAYFWAAAN